MEGLVKLKIIGKLGWWSTQVRTKEGKRKKIYYMIRIHSGSISEALYLILPKVVPVKVKIPEYNLEFESEMRVSPKYIYIKVPTSLVEGKNLKDEFFNWTRTPVEIYLDSRVSQVLEHAFQSGVLQFP